MLGLFIKMITSVFKMLPDFFKDVFVSIVSDRIIKLYPNISERADMLFNTERAYRKKLTKELKEMPFIYKDIDTDILNDYVAIEANTLDIGDLEKNNTSNQSLNVLSNKNKAIIFGSAGIGKTTFFRHSLLSIINKKQVDEYLKDSKDLIPVFIQLKAVDNFDKSPLIKYINSEITYFKGEKGLKRFLDLAKKRKLFMILDGYDEIGFIESTNFLKYELSILLSPIDGFGIYNSEYLDAKYKEIYSSLNSCKVWMSTRKEFFDLNPLQIMKNNLGGGSFRKVSSRDSNFIALTLNGLGNNRFNLIKIIFDKYKNQASLFRDKLNEEKFFYELRSINDEKIMELSKSPLFLTIMCYLYVNRFKEDQNADTAWLTSGYELINKCIHALLVDIDKYKVMHLNEVKRNVFINRRSAFQDEKLEFLQFFSYMLYVDGKNLVSQDYMIKVAKIYFHNYSKSLNRDVIISELNSSADLTNSNVVKQILYSGLFIMVPSTTKSYDFPHRRFKETLALDYIRKIDKIELNFLDRNLSEFVQVLFVNIPHRRSNIIDQILSRIDDNKSNAAYLNRLLINCIDLLGENYKIDNSASKLIEWVDGNCQVYVLEDLVINTRFESKNILNIISKINYSKINENSLNLCLSILYTKDRNIIKDIAEQQNEKFDSNYKQSIFELYSLMSRNLTSYELLEVLRVSFERKEYFKVVSVMFVDRLNRNQFIELVFFVLDNLQLKDKLIILYSIWALKENDYDRIKKLSLERGKSIYFSLLEYLLSVDFNLSGIYSSAYYISMQSLLESALASFSKIQRQRQDELEKHNTVSVEYERELERKKEYYSMIKKFEDELISIIEIGIDLYFVNEVSDYKNFHNTIKYGVVSEEQ